MSNTDPIQNNLQVSPSPLRAMAARLAASALKLQYAFISTPNPIRASTQGTNPNVVALQVMISNPTTKAVSVSKIEIQIPTGENIARTISSAPTLPTPAYDRSIPWTVAVSGSTITIEPTNDASGAVTDTILLSIAGITVNQAAGTVPITITEYPIVGTKVLDSQTYTLVKQPSNFPILDFSAQPATLDDLGLSTTLHWRCSSEGSRYAYKVYSEIWRPKPCQDAGTCFSCQDGTNGVGTPELQGTTIFALDVMEADSSGKLVARETLFTTVRVETPSISQTARCKSITKSGRLVEMRWLAYNAVRCSILLDGVVIDRNAPTDTYRSGYVQAILGATGRHQLAIIAHGASGAEATFTFPDITVQDSPSIRFRGSATGIAASADGKRAFVATFTAERMQTTAFLEGYQGFSEGFKELKELLEGHKEQEGSVRGSSNSAGALIEVLDLVQKKTERSIPMDIVPGQIAITGDGRFAVAAPHIMMSIVAILAKKGLRPNLDALTTVNISTLQAELRPTSISMTNAVATAGRGSIVLASGVGAAPTSTLLLMDASGQPLTNPTIQTAHTIGMTAVTPDGRTALGTAPLTNSVAVIDIDERRTLPNAISVGGTPAAVAITPDGKLGLVVGIGNELTIIDIPNRRAEQHTIAIGPSGWIDPPPLALNITISTIAISADGKLGFVLRESGSRLAVIDIPRRRLVASIPIQTAIALAVTGTTDALSILLAWGSEMHIL